MKAAKAHVLKAYPDTTIKNIALDKDDSLKVYEVELVVKQFEGNLEINPRTEVDIALHKDIGDCLVEQDGDSDIRKIKSDSIFE